MFHKLKVTKLNGFNEQSISISFGTPEHGWLPVDFRFNDFHLDFDA